MRPAGRSGTRQPPSAPLATVDAVLIVSFPAGPWQSNCYVVAADAGGPCVVIDPGVGARDGVAQVVAEHGLSIAGVLLTHGHIDHVGDAADVADGAGAPAWLHEDDRALLSDPGHHLVALPQLKAAFGTDLREPTDLRLLRGGETIEVAGLSFAVTHAPGHRPGCVMFTLGEVVFTGDVLFAGSIGRTDLPGGDHDVMLATLGGVVAALAPHLAVLPGHGPATTVAHELATNPYLQPSYLR